MITFTHGVASFDPTSDAVLLWTRVEGDDTVRWRVARDDAMTDVVAEGETTVDPEADRTVTVDATGLSPGTTYWYLFTAGGRRSPVGRTRTLPGDGATTLRLGLVSCARYSVAPLTAYRVLARRDVDLVVHLGDYIYEDDGSTGPRDNDPPWTAVTLDDYRRRIGQIRADPDTLALHQRHPMTAVWDDHDLADNAWTTGAKAHDPATQGPWSARRDAAVRARREWLPRRLPEGGRTWGSLVAGDLAELLLLDTRLAGRDQHPGDEGTTPADDPDRSLLGDEQRDWLGERLADVSRPWAVVVSSVVVNPIRLALPPAVALARSLPNGYAVVDGDVLHDDQWDGYLAERTLLAERLHQRADAGGRALVLSGDVHSSWAFQEPDEPEEPMVGLEVTTPSVSSAPMGRTRLPGIWRLIDAAVRQLDHVRWADVANRGFTVVELTRDEVRATWWFVDPYDVAEQPGARRGQALRALAAERPPRWEPAEPVGSEEDDEAALPARPDDLAAVRRWHLRRRWAGLTAIGGAAALGASASARAVLRRVR